MKRLADAVGLSALALFLSWGIGGLVCWIFRCRNSSIVHRLATGFVWLVLGGASSLVVWWCLHRLATLVRP